MSSLLLLWLRDFLSWDVVLSSDSGVVSIAFSIRLSYILLFAGGPPGAQAVNVNARLGAGPMPITQQPPQSSPSSGMASAPAC